MSFLQRTSEWKFAAALGAALAISACAKTPAENGAALAGLNGGSRRRPEARRISPSTSVIGFTSIAIPAT